MAQDEGDHRTKQKNKTFETQRNRGSRGQKEETRKSELEEQKPNLITRKSWEGAGSSKSLTTKITTQESRKPKANPRPLKRRGTEEAEDRRRKPENRNLKSKSQI